MKPHGEYGLRLPGHERSNGGEVRDSVVESVEGCLENTSAQRCAERNREEPDGDVLARR